MARLKKTQRHKLYRDSLVRSATSVTANVREAKCASSKKDYINFYRHALKSVNETEFWLQLVADTRGIINDKLLQETREIAKILAASIITMKKK